MNYSVVIVTYNRYELLKECICNALSCNPAPKHIIIVNNASTDETRVFLQKLSVKGFDESFGLPASSNTTTDFIIRDLPKNTGGAGGFYAGLKLALKQDSDWYVIIDDDAMLSEDYMQKIEQAANTFPDVKAFAGAVITRGEIQTDHRQRVKRPGFLFNKISTDEYSKKYFECDFASFCGLVLHREIIEKIGLPEKQYFIWYDDTEYCIRIRKESKIITVTQAIIDHRVKADNESWPRHYTWKDYYGIRNRLHMVKKHGNIIDYLYVRIFTWINSGLRNQIFRLLKYHGDDWSFECNTYKKSIKDVAKLRYK